MKKTIAFFPTIGLPIPAVKGGAIETLLEILINQNEIDNKFNFIIVSKFDDDALKSQQKYKNTVFVNIKEQKTDKLCLFFYKVLKKLSKGKIAPLFLSRLNSRAFKELKKYYDIDYVICEGGLYRDFYKISKYFGREKMVLHLHSEFVPDQYIESSFSRYIAISQFIANKWRERLKNKQVRIDVLKNCIDQKKFKESEINLDIRKQYNISKRFLIVYVGRIIPIKGVEQLINAFILADIPDSSLMIIGSVNFGAKANSEYSKRIEKKAQEDGRIILTGFIHNNILPSYLSAADLFVIPSLCQEGAGLVALEGGCLRKKMIITVSGGLPEFVPNELCYKIEKDKYFKESIAGDITNELVERTDWSNFEKELSTLLLKAYEQREHPVKLTCAEFFEDFTPEAYYNGFTEIISKYN